MNLLKSFPEIEVFFKNEMFTQEDLDNLIKHVKKIYNEVELLNAAITLINLEVAKFEIIRNQTDLNARIKKTHDSHKRPNKQDNSKFPGNIPCDVTNLANKLEITRTHLIHLLDQKSIHTINGVIDINGMNTLKPFIQSRLKALNKQKKSHSKSVMATAQQYLNRELHDGINVYDKLGLFGLGKVIYIRSR